MSEPLEIEFEEYIEPGASKMPSRRWLIIAAAIVALVLVAACMIGWQLMHRLDTSWAEREARQKLSTEARWATTFRGWGQGPKVVGLQNGDWAKRDVRVLDISDSMARNASSAFPFRAVILIELRERHSVSHSTREEADRDSELYDASVGYYPEVESYQRLTEFGTTEIKLLEYDLWGREWLERDSTLYAGDRYGAANYRSRDWLDTSK